MWCASGRGPALPRGSCSACRTRRPMQRTSPPCASASSRGRSVIYVNIFYKIYIHIYIYIYIHSFTSAWHTCFIRLLPWRAPSRGWRVSCARRRRLCRGAGTGSPEARECASPQKKTCAHEGERDPCWATLCSCLPCLPCCLALLPCSSLVL